MCFNRAKPVLFTGEANPRSPPTALTYPGFSPWADPHPMVYAIAFRGLRMTTTKRLLIRNQVPY